MIGPAAVYVLDTTPSKSFYGHLNLVTDIGKEEPGARQGR